MVRESQKGKTVCYRQPLGYRVIAQEHSLQVKPWSLCIVLVIESWFGAVWTDTLGDDPCKYLAAPDELLIKLEPHGLQKISKF